MDNAINVTPSLADGISELDAAREAVGNAATKTGDVIKAYAKQVQKVFGERWFELKGKDKKPIKAEREKFVAMMVARGVQENSTNDYWKRVKLASGYVTTGNRVKGAETCDEKTLAELKTIINRIFKAEEDGQEPKASEYKGMLMDVYGFLGGDVDTLG
ncbi:hypothetical protein EBT25_11875 [bacterium]|nr:hypothetical protein [bacterium]